MRCSVGADVGLDDHLVVGDVDVEVGDRDLDRDEAALGVEDGVGVLELEDRFGEEVVEHRRDDDVEQAEAGAQQVREPLLDVVGQVEDVAHQVDERAEDRLDQVARPAGQEAQQGVDRCVDGVLEQVADDVGDVEDVDVDALGIDEDLPLVGHARVLGVDVVHPRLAARVHEVPGPQGRDERHLRPEQAREVQRDGDVRVAREDADLRQPDRTAERRGHDAPAADADARDVDPEADGEGVPDDVELPDAHGVVAAQVDAAVLEVERHGVRRRERTEAAAVRGRLAEGVAQLLEERGERRLGGGDGDVTHGATSTSTKSLSMSSSTAGLCGTVVVGESVI
jgi:hypothetical protein